ncbi:MAG: glycosyltransferase [Candidatus Dependentiae bacterium]|nr:glycosyltransferase [Candidatus Dependentiae bacterium]
MKQISFFFKNQLITAFFCSLIAVSTAIIAHPEPHLQQPKFDTPVFEPLEKPCNVVIIIPAYNEESRIEKTLSAYFDYFNKLKNVSATFLVVCNNCSDNTVGICRDTQSHCSNLHYLNLKPGGKGFAVKQGFLKALEFQDTDFIGFVDADMATAPDYFYELITKIKKHDGIIASRYKNGARVWPNRPFIKKIGGKFYNWVLRQNFHLDVRDTQCGAKLFSYETVATVAPHMKETGWAFDLELLYLCQLFDKDIIEIPTTWVDKPGSHLAISSCYKEFISAPLRIKKEHKKLAGKLSREKSNAKAAARKQARLERQHHHHNPQFMASK